MKPKRISIRFNLENKADRKAWEHLQGAENSKNSTIISAINAFFEPDNMHIADVVRQTIRECFQNVLNVRATPAGQPSTLSEDESALLDTLDEFLGG
ncbi:MAG: hypothetical protein PHV32_08450 [Eubacteriales bacterium]|nr:hypothetical protein [Eubacteriales bacterium]